VDDVAVTLTRHLGPATAGLWRPRVLLPRWALALPTERRRFVVRHEEEHRRAHDAALLAVASVVVALMPWNLTLWWHLRRLQLAVEVDCDRRVVAALGDPTGYGDLLLDVAETASRGPRLQPALLGGRGTLERRLTALLTDGRRGLVEWVLAPVVAIAMVAVVLSVPHPELQRQVPPREPSAEAGRDAREANASGQVSSSAHQHDR
jgi:bla regulator protein blaR1